LKNELWCDLNIYVIAKWAQNPARSEEEVFNEYAVNVLKLSAGDVPKFRQLALLSADAVYRGKRSTDNSISALWTRDEFIGVPPLPGDVAKRSKFLAEKDDAVHMWEEIDALANEIRFPDPKVGEYVRVSSRYGLLLYRIYRAGFNLSALGSGGDRNGIKRWIGDYDSAWAEYRALPAKHPSCATLYQDKGFGFDGAKGAFAKPGIGEMVDQLRKGIE
jgi:hypothetical protein